MLRTRFLSPDPALVEGWERANVHLDGLVRAALATGRTEAGFADQPLHHEACRAARQLLLQGDREAAKDLIRSLARARESGSLSEALVPSLEHLVIGFNAWTADSEFLDRYPGLAGLNRTVPPRPASSPSRDGSAGVVIEVAERLWGLWADATTRELHLAPTLEEGWSGMALLGLRVGATHLDLRFYRSASGSSLGTRRTHGPRLRVTVWLQHLDPRQVWIDNEPLGGRRAVFELAGEHELRIDL